MYPIVVINSSIAQSTLRSATEQDLLAIASIYRPYVTDSVITFELEAPDVDEWRHRWQAITGSGFPFLVAEIGNEVLGYAYCSPWKTRPAYRQTLENSIYLKPAATGHGLGGALLDRLLEESRAIGIREVIAVIADTGSPASVALHRSRGFTDAGRLKRVGFKHERWVDTVLMQCSLADE